MYRQSLSYNVFNNMYMQSIAIVSLRLHLNKQDPDLHIVLSWRDIDSLLSLEPLAKNESTAQCQGSEELSEGIKLKKSKQFKTVT